MFTVVRSVLLRPLPFKDPERLIRLYESEDKFPHNEGDGGFAIAEHPPCHRDNPNLSWFGGQILVISPLSEFRFFVGKPST